MANKNRRLEKALTIALTGSEQGMCAEEPADLAAGDKVMMRPVTAGTHKLRTNSKIVTRMRRKSLLMLQSIRNTR